MDSGLYHYDETRGREETFVVDTPPPTVSGSLHVGHVFSYTHQDLIVRYQRMIGKNIALQGGVAKNPAVPLAFAMETGRTITVPPDPAAAGAGGRGGRGRRCRGRP